MPVPRVQTPGVFPGIRRLFIAVFCCTIVLGTSGCKYWYKPGGTAAELQRDEDTCRAQAGAANSTPEFVDCMRTLGWSGSQPNSPAPSAEASAKDNRGKNVPAYPDAPAEPTHVPDAAPVQLEQSVEPRIQDPGITSWWKLGGSTEQLTRDQNACLGRFEKNPPGDDIVWEASPELLKCMKDRGWRPVH